MQIHINAFRQALRFFVRSFFMPAALIPESDCGEGSPVEIAGASETRWVHRSF